MAEESNWNLVDYFTVHQAACLWCQYDPSKFYSMLDNSLPGEVLAARQMLISEIEKGTLSIIGGSKGFSRSTNYVNCLVSHGHLKALANSKNTKPAFLFDTLLANTEARPSRVPEVGNDGGSHSVEGTDHSTPSRRGRPQEYDWDTFILEIIRKANSTDGLPQTQAELVKDMLQWFSDTFDNEPAESSVKARISKIYRYLEEAKNSQV